VSIEVVTAEPGLATVRTLFREYAAGLGVDLAFQDFERELSELPGDYVAPSGTLILFRCGDDPTGCVAVRKWSEGSAELKRMFVRDRFRGRGYGSRLLAAALEFARAAGYARILLDTLPSMTDAQRQYRKAGFLETAPYRFNPVPGATFMALMLNR
jgi:GNAT superfamily N-acetyltransferase